MEKYVKIVFFDIIFTFIVITAHGLDYSDLVNLNASCFPYDSCATAGERSSFPVLRCDCKPSCVKSNTCCIDSPHRDPIATSVFQRRRRGTCQEVLPDGVKTFVTTKCDSKWRGEAIVSTLCESQVTNWGNPLSILPVTNLKSKVTYRNYFCAVCNNDAQPIEFWRIKINGPPPANQSRYEDNNADILQSLIHKEEYEKEGNQLSDDNDLDFVELNIDFQVPDYLADIVSPCIPDLVSTCHSTWKDEKIRRKCGSYMAVVYIKSKVKRGSSVISPVVPIAYRNIHCAICNFETYSAGTVCNLYKSTQFRFKRDANRKPSRPPMSFAFIFDLRHVNKKNRQSMNIGLIGDMNINDGDKVGEVNPCKKGQIYDRFFRKCRKLQCGLPGFAVKNGRCVKRSTTF